jgi:hypothetical protein
VTFEIPVQCKIDAVEDNLNLRRIYQKQLYLILLLSDIYFFNWNL